MAVLPGHCVGHHSYPVCHSEGFHIPHLPLDVMPLRTLEVLTMIDYVHVRGPIALLMNSRFRYTQSNMIYARCRTSGSSMYCAFCWDVLR